MSLKDKINEFKEIVKVTDSLVCVRENLLARGCYVLSNEVEENLYGEVSEFFNVNADHLFIVGSAKLGFSIKPGSRFRPFGDTSDIDLVMVDKMLFERVWMEVYNYIQSGEYWVKKNEFYYYLSKGWIRPDKLPNARSFDFTKRWWGYFQELTYSEKFGRYKISGALYFNQFFFESYQRICVEQLKQDLI